jgi:hypothetical protein
MSKKIPKKPEMCDCCLEEYELHWSQEEEMWICDACDADLYEKRAIDQMYYQDSLKHMCEEADWECPEFNYDDDEDDF